MVKQINLLISGHLSMAGTQSPARVKTKGRPVGAKKKKGKRREPSQFEKVILKKRGQPPGAKNKGKRVKRSASPSFSSSSSEQENDESQPPPSPSPSPLSSSSSASSSSFPLPPHFPTDPKTKPLVKTSPAPPQASTSAVPMGAEPQGRKIRPIRAVAGPHPLRRSRRKAASKVTTDSDFMPEYQEKCLYCDSTFHTSDICPKNDVSWAFFLVF